MVSYRSPKWCKQSSTIILFSLSPRAVYKTPGLTPGRGQNIFDCKYTMPPPPGQVCDVNIKDFDKCTQENNYSYHKSSPCIFLKLNKIYGWIPAFYNDTGNLPDKMPKSLRHIIAQTNVQEVRFRFTPTARVFHCAYAFIHIPLISPHSS